VSPLLSLAPAVLAIAQVSGAPTERASRPVGEPVAVAVSATVTILRPAVIDIDAEARRAGDDRQGGTRARQRRIDAAGTIWIDFS